MKHLLTAQNLNMLFAASTLGYLGFGFLLEWTGLIPCPICIVIRVGLFCCLGLSLAFALIQRHKLRQYLAGLMILMLLGTTLMAFRLWWLETSQVPLSCGMPVSFMLLHLPLSDLIQALWMGGCQNTPTWLGLSLAGWTAIGCLGLMTLPITLFINIKRQQL